MDDLIAFIRAQLDADEQATRAVEDRSHPWDGQWVADEDGNGLRTYNGHVLVAGYRGPLKRGLVEHMARWAPARVLAEVEAKRRIVDYIAEELEDRGADNPYWYEGSLAPILHALALPYADYQEEWQL